jgi:hypothetical protein
LPSLRESRAYQVDWRFRIVEQYLLQIVRAEDKSAQLDVILVRETDPYTLSGEDLQPWFW